jgi:transposase-like protein
MSIPDRNCPDCHSEMEHCVNVRVRDGEVYPDGWLCAKCQITVPWEEASHD